METPDPVQSVLVEELRALRARVAQLESELAAGVPSSPNATPFTPGESPWLVRDNFRTLFQSSPIPICITTLADGRFVEINASYLKLSGFGREELIGKTVVDLGMWHADNRAGWVAKLVAHGARQDEERKFYTRDGMTRDTLVNCEVIDFDGERCILAQFHDITERNQAEERARRQIQRLSAVHAMDLVLTSSMDLRLTLEIFLQHAITQLNVDAADILCLNPVTQTLEFFVGQGLRNPVPQRISLHSDQEDAGRAVLTRRTVHIPNLSESPNQTLHRSFLLVEGVRSYWGVPLIAKGQVKGVIELFTRAPLNPDPEWQNFMDTLAGQAAIAIDNAELFEDLQRSNVELSLAYDTTLEGWARALDLRDKETEGHTQRVVELAVQLAARMGLADAELIQLRRGALLHDIGKMGVPDAILRKPSALTESEWKIMRQHPVYAYEVLRDIPFLHAALEVPYCHHEKWDGGGYPRGLAGEEIPLAARIFAVVDVWDAITSTRAYRPPMPPQEARAYMEQQTGKHFDPTVVAAFLSMLDDPGQGTPVTGTVIGRE
ncbi:MAG: HD domain-containing phosphohydrolase [Anaerolineae bacterium]